METKKCFKCEKEKELSMFYKHKEMKDGHLNKCIECTKKDVSTHRANNLEKIRRYDRDRGQLPHRVEARKRYQKTKEGKEAIRKGISKWGKNNREKIYAQGLLSRAVKKGRIIKQPCEKCGEKKVHGHHDDYFKPLEVRWLCIKCHNAFHKNKREQERKGG